MAVDDGWCGPVFFASCTMRARGMVIETLPPRRWWHLRSRRPETV